MWDAFKKRSSSNWEDSYFGGYRKILLDYPYIKMSDKVSANLPTSYDLGPYSTRKLLQIFLLKTKQFNLYNKLTENITKDGNRLKISKSSIENTVTSLVERDDELSNLFKFYNKVLANIELELKLGEGEEDDDKGMGGKKGAEGKEGEDDKEAMKEAAKSILSKTEKEENPWTTGGMGTTDSISRIKQDVRFVLMKSFNKPCKYEADELFQAKLLIDRLDIDFDPDRDRLDGLRTGKLDTAKIASIPAGDQNVYYKIEENLSTKPFSVCILMDESGSMGSVSPGQKAYSQHKAAKMLYKCFSQILPLDKIYIYGHSGYDSHTKPEIRVYHDKLNPVFEYTITRQIHNSFNENYDGPVIESVYEKVRSFTDDNIIFISLSDGNPAGHNYGGKPAIIEMKKIIEKCKRDGFVTVGIGLHYEGVRGIYNYNTVIHDLSNASSKISTLINNVVKKEFQ